MVFWPNLLEFGKFFTIRNDDQLHSFIGRNLTSVDVFGMDDLDDGKVELAGRSDWDVICSPLGSRDDRQYACSPAAEHDADDYTSTLQYAYFTVASVQRLNKSCEEMIGVIFGEDD